MTMLAVNAGSSTLKFALYPILNGKAQTAVLTGLIDGLATTLGTDKASDLRLSWQFEGKKQVRVLPATHTPFETALRGLQDLLSEWLLQSGSHSDSHSDKKTALQAVAHRVVHGGEFFRSAVLVDAGVMRKLQTLISLAPLHQPHNLKGIEAFTQAFPQVPQIACFDTAFHATLRAEEYRFALPETLTQQGIRRYGFHGLSYQFVSASLGQISAKAQGRVLMAHLGNGASLCAMLAGESRATTMGFSALDGLIMGSRSGALDPGVVLHLLAQGWNHAQLEDLLYRQSGLLGVSGLSGDMRRLRESGTQAANLAIAMFVQRIVHECGAMVASMGGLDVLAFTGGIGENDSILRAEVAERLRFLGLVLDHHKNQCLSTALSTGPSTALSTPAHSIHAPESSVEIWVVPTDEGKVAAQAAIDLCANVCADVCADVCAKPA
jgi:acetate kinase